MEFEFSRKIIILVFIIFTIACCYAEIFIPLGCIGFDSDLITDYCLRARIVTFCAIVGHRVTTFFKIKVIIILIGPRVIKTCLRIGHRLKYAIRSQLTYISIQGYSIRNSYSYIDDYLIRIICLVIVICLAAIIAYCKIIYSLCRRLRACDHGIINSVASICVRDHIPVLNIIYIALGYLRSIKAYDLGRHIGITKLKALNCDSRKRLITIFTGKKVQIVLGLTCADKAGCRFCNIYDLGTADSPDDSL